MNRIESLMRCFEYLDDKYMQTIMKQPSSKKLINPTKAARNGTKREWSADELVKIVNLRQQGKSLDDIAAVMDASGPTIRRALTSQNVK